tara:strand:+ start:110468 stop:111574 length:1107 start_codon:yes stop_codon:yes gene_type:complete
MNEGFLKSVAMGSQMGRAASEARDRREYRKALGVLATDPENQNALVAAFQHDPRVGIALMDRADEKAFARSAAEWAAPGGQPNALMGMGSPASRQPDPQPNALLAGSAPQSRQPVTVGAAPPVAGDAGAQARAAPDGSQGEAPQADLSSLGEPQDGADRAFINMLRRDPEKAIKLRSTMRDNFVDQLEAESDFYGLAIGELSRATDQATWNAALRNLLPHAKALGMDMMQAVPPTYPGPEGVQELMQRAQPVKEQMDYLLREANMEADNARADRNVDSQIEVREGRLDEYRRSNRAREGNQRRGQDISSRDRRRGQNIGSQDRRRGQDMRGNRSGLPVVSSPEEARKLPPGTSFRVKGSKRVLRTPGG